MIKRIQLRGISRSPSDHVTADGGCSESLNVQLEEGGELGPIPFPADKSSTIYGDNLSSQTNRMPIYYIHKLPSGQENYIGYTSGAGSGTLKAYVNGALKSMGIISGTLRSIVGRGNMLIAYTTTSPYYFLFKPSDSSYVSLGTSVPRPEIEVVSIPFNSPRSGNINSCAFTLPDYFVDSESIVSAFNDAKSEGSEHHPELLEAMENLWNAAEVAINQTIGNGYFNAPFFIRYAVRLYDGSYVHASVPILCGGGEPKWIEANIGYDGSTPARKCGWVNLKNGFKVGLKMAAFSHSEWDGLISSIDFFISSPVYAPSIRSGFSEMFTDDGTAYFRFIGEEEDVFENTVRNEILSKSNFYKVLSVGVGSSAGSVYSDMVAGEYIFENSESIGTGEKLYTNERFPDDYRSSNQYLDNGTGSMNFNNRVMLPGATEKMTTGEMFLNGLVVSRVSGSLSTKRRYIFKFNISSETGSENIVVSRGHESALGNYSLEGGYVLGLSYSTDTIVQHFAEDTDENGFATTPYAWIAYPDTRCKSVTLYYYQGNNLYRSGTIQMQPHPSLECAYAFFGLGETLSDQCTTVYQNHPSYNSNTFSDENRVIDSPNKLFLSEIDNPFVYTPGNIITFTDKLIGAALTSVPLSEGQLGQFTLYVFTEGGIRTLETNTEGTFSFKNTPVNLARHVALPGTILGIEQIVVFVTKKGVMLLSGGSVECISDNMNGRHWTLDTGLPNDAKLSTMLASPHWAGYAVVPDQSDTTTFMGFVSTAKVAYDYQGARFIFLKAGKPYHYVYMLKTRSWHKMTAPLTAFTVLNSFPDCLIANTSNSTQNMVYNYSTVLDDASVLSDTTSPRYGIVMTRPLALDESDVRKAIKSVRVRGRFNRADVKYLLLGSFDEINWYILPSLRGGSYKFFRVVLLTKLSPTERISWIDIDFDARFKNRLR